MVVFFVASHGDTRQVISLRHASLGRVKQTLCKPGDPRLNQSVHTKKMAWALLTSKQLVTASTMRQFRTSCSDFAFFTLQLFRGWNGVRRNRELFLQLSMACTVGVTRECSNEDFNKKRDPSKFFLYSLSCLVLYTPQAGRTLRAGGRAGPPPPPQYMLRRALASPRVGARITRVPSSGLGFSIFLRGGGG
jgi:hypothetical protein